MALEVESRVEDFTAAVYYTQEDVSLFLLLLSHPQSIARCPKSERDISIGIHHPSQPSSNHYRERTHQGRSIGSIETEERNWRFRIGCCWCCVASCEGCSRNDDTLGEGGACPRSAEEGAVGEHDVYCSIG